MQQHLLHVRGRTIAVSGVLIQNYKANLIASPQFRVPLAVAVPFGNTSLVLSSVSQPCRPMAHASHACAICPRVSKENGRDLIKSDIEILRLQWTTHKGLVSLHCFMRCVSEQDKGSHIKSDLDRHMNNQGNQGSSVAKLIQKFRDGQPTKTSAKKCFSPLRMFLLPE